VGLSKLWRLHKDKRKEKEEPMGCTQSRADPQGTQGASGAMITTGNTGYVACWA
jgi:hypothetical protein